MHTINFNQPGWPQIVADGVVRVVRTHETPNRLYSILIGNNVAYQNLLEADDRVVLAQKIAASLPGLLQGVATQAMQINAPPAFRMSRDKNADPRTNAQGNVPGE